MEGLFFVVDPVWWSNPIQMTSVFSALIWGCILGIYLWYKNKSENPKIEAHPQKYDFHPISTSDPEYAEKTLNEIRKYLAYNYTPHHSWAHILDDIKSYSNDTRLIDIIKQLENIEYSHENMSYTELNSINIELTKKIQT